MKSRLYTCPRCRKDIKSTSDLTRYVNAWKIPIILPSCPISKSIAILKDNTINCLDLPLDNNEKSISLRISNYGKEKI